jgi:hypothetical protein
MEWKQPVEQAAIGFLGYGAVSLALSPTLLSFSLSSLSGALTGFGYGYLRPLPWRRYFLSKGKRACVSVSKDLRFKEVSTNAPANQGFIRFEDLDKKELFARLSGKRLDPATIPFHMKLHLEQGRQLEIPWSAIEPYLRPL